MLSSPFHWWAGPQGTEPDSSSISEHVAEVQSFSSNEVSSFLCLQDPSFRKISWEILAFLIHFHSLSMVLVFLFVCLITVETNDH